MLSVSDYFLGLAGMLIFAVLIWLVSLTKKDVSIVDSIWSLLFLLGAVIYYATTEQRSSLSYLTLALVALWAIRLAVYITWRNHGHGEDRRYRAMRERNDPNFAFKSIYIVFGLQAVLAWIISIPLWAAIQSTESINAVAITGLVLWIIGMFFEAIGDWQMAKFKSDPANKGKVMNTGLWRYTRHPNYFGNAVIWWGFYCLALSTGAWWTIIAPALMTFLLLKVSGVAMLEKDISDRRPEYSEYIKNTSAFIPWFPKNRVTNAGI